MLLLIGIFLKKKIDFLLFLKCFFLFFLNLRWEINYVIVITFYKIKKNLKRIWYFLYFKNKYIFQNSFLQIK